MKTVKTLNEAYAHFRPYDPSGDSETVTIHNSDGTTFLHWDKARAVFTADDNRGNKWDFQGRYIDTMYREERSQAKADIIVPPAPILSRHLH